MYYCFVEWKRNLISYDCVTRLMNKVAVITGGARGIGGASAKLMAEHGAHVVIADVLDELGTSLANSINGRFVHCDVSIESDVEAAIQLAVTWKGKLDILFNNAGIGGITFSSFLCLLSKYQYKSIMYTFMAKLFI